MKPILHIIIFGLFINSGTLIAQDQEKLKKQEIQIRVDGNNQDKAYHVKVVTDEDGTRKEYEKTYGSLEEMESDSSISIHVTGDQDKTFNIKVDKLPEDFEWVEASDSAAHKVIKTKGGNFVFINEDEPMLKIISDGDSSKTETYEIRITKEGDSLEGVNEIRKEILVLKDDEGNISIHPEGEENEMIWMENGSKTIQKINVRKSVISQASIQDLIPGDRDFPDFNIASIPELTLKSLNYYPNPSEGEFTLSFSGPKKPIILRILDPKGNLKYEEEINDFSGYYNQVINVKKYNKGNYLLQIHQQGKVLNKKLILE
jgi:hypothetical protein